MIETLQSLRFIFVMMIFMSHFDYGGIRAFDAGGDCGVAFFLILSGFVMSLGYGGKIRHGTFSYGRYMRRRLLKLYPLHMLCLVFFMLASKSGLSLKVVLNMLLLQSWIPCQEYYFSCNSVSWFLSTLFFCYLIFPFAYRHMSAWFSTVILTVGLLAYLLVPADKTNALLYVNPLMRFADFYIGMLLCRLYERGIRLSHPTACEVLIVVCLVAAVVAYPYADVKLRNAPLFWTVLVPLVLVFAQGTGRLSAWLRCMPLKQLAAISMPIFLTHQMLIGIVTAKLPALPDAVMLFACILTVLTASWLIDRLVLSKIARMA